MLSEIITAVGRLWLILRRADWRHGLPLVRRFLDVVEAIKRDNRPGAVAPFVLDFLNEIEAKCPGVMSVVLRLGTDDIGSPRPGPEGDPGAVGGIPRPGPADAETWAGLEIAPPRPEMAEGQPDRGTAP